jgi:spore coat polysaccharide biosynthesis protein SpsF
MRVVIIVQARMTSSRLPGKVLMEVSGRPMLAWQIERLQRCAAHEIVLATTTNAGDDPVVELAARLGIRSFRGSEHDVLARFVGAARQAHADVVVRVTADCPLLDPAITDRVINELLEHRAECDYASNVSRRTYPRGLDVEAFFWDVLLRMDRLGTSQPAREHVTIVPRMERPDSFLCRSVEDTADNSDLRWTVDDRADLEMIRGIYAGLGGRIAPYAETLAYARAHPELTRLNAGGQTWEPVR